MERFLLIDFGASFIKSTIFNKSNGTFEKTYSIDSPKIINGEIKVNDLQNIFFEITKKQNFDAVLISSQMHGFALYIEDKKQFLTNYISWYKKSSNEREDFSSINGNFPFDGIPIYNLKNLDIKEKVKYFSLPEVLLPESNVVHDTLFCGSGIYDIKNNIISKEILNSLLIKNLAFNKITNNVEVSCFYKNKPVFCGFGDLQTAIYGTEIKEGEIVINLGTGSQVLVISKGINTKTENRNYFNKYYLNTIAHIPSGRVLNCYFNLIGDSNDNIFKKLNRLNLDDIYKSNLKFNLNIFGEGVSINNIFEENYNLNNYLSSLIKSYCDQYIGVIRNNFDGYKVIILSGGIAHKIPVIKEYLENELKLNIKKIKSEIHETLIGLSRLTKLIKD